MKPKAYADNNMKVQSICFLCDDFPSEGRPVFVFVEQLVNSLVNYGITVSVIAPQSITRSLVRRIPLLPKEMIYVTSEGKSYSVFRPFTVSFGNNNRTLYKIFKGYNENNIYKVLKKINPDILYGHFWHSAYKMMSYYRKNHKPLFVACGEGDNALENMVKSLPEEKKKEFVKAVKGVISVSTENKRKSISLGLCKEKDTIVLPNCVDTSLFHPMSPELMKKKLGIKDDDFIIAFIGAFIKRKGSQILSEAINKINDKNIKVIFIGKPLEGEDFTPICDGIIHIGPVDHALIPSFLNAADVFVLPTLKEGCSNAIVEALACGLPVISSDRPFNDDILNDNNSIRINPEDVDSIVNAIIKLKNDKVLYNHLKTYCLDHSSQYSIKIRAKKIIEFINSRI